MLFGGLTMYHVDERARTYTYTHTHSEHTVAAGTDEFIERELEVERY